MKLHTGDQYIIKNSFTRNNMYNENLITRRNLVNYGYYCYITTSLKKGTIVKIVPGNILYPEEDEVFFIFDKQYTRHGVKLKRQVKALMEVNDFLRMARLYSRCSDQLEFDMGE